MIRPRPIVGALLASFGAAALLLAPQESFARSPVPQGGVSPPAHPGHPTFRPGGPSHHRGAYPGAVYPGALWGGGDNRSSGNNVYVAPPPSTGDYRYTYTYDVPWDAIHRFPQMAPPYVPGCHAQSVVVPGRGGGDHTVNITRCY